jgi:hypothetical protein
MSKVGLFNFDKITNRDLIKRLQLYLYELVIFQSLNGLNGAFFLFAQKPVGMELKVEVALAIILILKEAKIVLEMLLKIWSVCMRIAYMVKTFLYYSHNNNNINNFYFYLNIVHHLSLLIHSFIDFIQTNYWVCMLNQEFFLNS